MQIVALVVNPQGHPVCIQSRGNEGPALATKFAVRDGPGWGQVSTKLESASYVPVGKARTSHTVLSYFSSSF